MPSVEHRNHKRRNNRAENAHPPTRQRERTMRCFTAVGQAQRFLSPFGPSREQFCPRRQRLTAQGDRVERTPRFPGWNEVTAVAMAAEARSGRRDQRLRMPA
jgi:putative transposase